MNRDELLAKGKPEIVTIKDVPKLGSVDTLKMSGGMRDAWSIYTQEHFRLATDEEERLMLKDGEPMPSADRKTLLPKPSAGSPRAKLLAMVLCDHQGTLLFDHTNPADLKVVGGLDFDAFNYLEAEVRRINGLGAAAAEGAEKNLKGEPNSETG